METHILGTLNDSYKSFSDVPYCGSVAWLMINIFTTLVTILGNILTISAILLSKKLSSTLANQFVFSLAVSDLLVGFSIPYHMSFYLTENFGRNKINCLLRFVLISFACSSSICNLLFIATDRYVAIVYPFHYSRYMTRKTSLFLITVGWLISFSVALVPLVWNEWRPGIKCEMIAVVPNVYVNFVVSPMFVLIWVLMLLLYSRICQEANGHAKRIRNANSAQNMLAIRDSRSFQVMMTILGCFTFCWLPYFAITLYARTSSKKLDLKYALLYELAFNLAVANSGMNPLIYAWKNTNFRKAFLCLVKCKSPNTVNSNYVTNHVPSKKNSLSMKGICNAICKEEIEMQCRNDKCSGKKEENGSVTTELSNVESSPKPRTV